MLRPDPNTILWAIQDQVIPHEPASPCALSSVNFTDPSYAARRDKEHFGSSDLYAAYPTILGDVPLRDIHFPLLGFDTIPCPVDANSIAVPPSDSAELGRLVHGGKEMDLSCMPSLLCCPTVHPINAAHIPLWEPVSGAELSPCSTHVLTALRL